MKINPSKCKVMAFNVSKKFQLNPTLKFDDKVLDVVESTKLLGVICSANGNWSDNTKHLTSKANQSLYL